MVPLLIKLCPLLIKCHTKPKTQSGQTIKDLPSLIRNHYKEQAIQHPVALKKTLLEGKFSKIVSHQRTLYEAAEHS